MPKKTGWPWWAKATVVLIGLAGFGYVRIRGVASDAMQGLNLVGWADFDSTGVDWNGDLVAHKVRIWPFEGNPDTDSVTAERMIIDTPGWGWVLKSAMPSFSASSLLKGKAKRFARRAEKSLEDDAAESPFGSVPEMARVHATFENVVFSDFVQSLAFEDHYVGLASGGLLESEGCGDDSFWTESEVADSIGLANQGVTFELDLNTTGAESVAVLMRLRAPGRSSWAYESSWQAPHQNNAIAIDWIEAKLKNERWTVEDDGFVAARNAFCAKRAGISEAEFIDRHVQYAQRRLLASGALASAALVEHYRAFASDGGHRLIWEANPSDAITLDKLYSFSGADALWMLNSNLRIDDADAQPFKLHFVTAVPYPEDERVETPEQIAGIVSTASIGLPVEVAPAPAEAVAQTPNLAIPTMVVGASAVVAVDGEVPTADKPINENITFDDLQYMIGERVIIKTNMNSRREGTLTGYNRAGIRLVLSNRPGMELEIPKDTVVDVEVVWTKSQSAAAAAAANGSK